MASDYNIKYFSIFFILMTFALPTQQRHSRRHDENHKGDDRSSGNDITRNRKQESRDSNCWITLSASQHFTIMDNLEKKYAQPLKFFHRKVASRLNAAMLKALLDTSGKAYRAIHNTAGDLSQIPAGLNLGGHCMIVLEDSLLFFFRIKLRNNTIFQVNYLENDLMNMIVESHLSLNDLHLIGAYERTPIYKDPSVLFHVPSYGEIEVLLKNVNYKMEGRLRLQGNRLVIETIISELVAEDILLTYNNANISRSPIIIQPDKIDDFLDRIKNDVDLWLKDYFNDYYTYFQFPNVDKEFRQYDKLRLLAYNRYSDFVLNRIKQRMYDLEIYNVRTPKFTLNDVPNVQIQLSNGAIRGLNTIFKKSFTTGRRKRNIRHVDMTIGFSNLKVEYQLDVILPNGGPALSGHLQLTADDLTAQLQLSMIQNPETIDLKFSFIKQLKPIALTVEGAANRVIANYKHLLENHVIILMWSELFDSIKTLGTITRCRPYLNPNYEKHSLLRSRHPVEESSYLNEVFIDALNGTKYKAHRFMEYGKNKTNDVIDNGKNRFYELGKQLLPKFKVYIQMTPDSPPMGPVIVSLAP